MSLFGTDGIRSRAGEGPLSPPSVRRLGAVIGRLLARAPGRFHTRLPRGAAVPPRARGGAGRGAVLIGRDPRASGPAIEEALIEGLSRAGAAVWRAGVVPTPAVAHLTRRWGCALGVVISASHNPAGDNGIKLISGEGFKVADATEEAIEELLADGAVGPRRRRAPPPRDVSSRAAGYAADVLESALCPPLGGMRVVADCAHGAASALAPALLAAAGARVTVIHAAPDGRNINRGCGAVHPEAMAARVRREGAALGVAFDGDGDRAIFADERGTVRDGDDVLFLAALDPARSGGLAARTVVGTGMTNFGLELAFRRRRIALRRAPVGDRFVAEEMLRCGAGLGGEPSGHVIDFLHATTGDGMLTALLLLRILAGGKGPFSRQAAAGGGAGPDRRGGGGASGAGGTRATPGALLGDRAVAANNG